MSGNGERDEIQTASYRNSYWDVKHSIGNLVSSIVITMVSDGNQTIQSDHFVSYRNFWSLCCTNIIFMSTIIENKLKRQEQCVWKVCVPRVEDVIKHCHLSNFCFCFEPCQYLMILIFPQLPLLFSQFAIFFFAPFLFKKIAI